jgi:uncharacterized membrane protein
MFSENFMRPEVWHALSVHFPIALLPVATITVLVSFFITDVNKKHWRMAGTFLLFAGCLTAWIAIYTGNIADGVVARKLCDPTVLKDHEIAGQTMTYLFTAAAGANLLGLTNMISTRLKVLAFYLSFLLMLTGTGYIVYTGHIGATLVYDQGAGVKDHKVDCSKYK